MIFLTQCYSESILEDLTPYDVRQLVMMEDEMAEIKASISYSKSSPFSPSLSYLGLNYVFNEVLVWFRDY